MKVEELLGERLPHPWNYGVTRDGRVFFVNEESHENSWLHPVTGQPVQTGHRSNEELPQGWEYAYTIEGIPYFIDHIQQRNTFQHPVTGEQYAIPWSPAQENLQQQQQQYAQQQNQQNHQQIEPGQQEPRQQHPQHQEPWQQDLRQHEPWQQDSKQQEPWQQNPEQQEPWQQNQRQQDPRQHEPWQQDPGQPGIQQQDPQGNPFQQQQRAGESAGVPPTSETQPPQPFIRQKSDRKRQSTKRKSKSRVVKGIPEPKRDFNAAVSQKGWLYKQEGGGLKSWKKRFIVLSDFCLFFYKESSEEDCIGAISLPSYSINPCLHDTNISKKYAFKAEHQNLKTHYFAAENEGDMKTWMNALSLASIAQTESKNPQRDTEQEEDAGFSGSKSPNDNMKRISANQLFPPQQQRYQDGNQHQHQQPPQHHGYHRNQNPPQHLQDRSDSYSQGSGSNRSAMNSSGNQSNRDPGYHGYPHNPQEMRPGSHNLSQSNSDTRSSGIHDPFFVQSPPDEGYNMQAYDPTRQINQGRGGTAAQPRDARFRPENNADPRLRDGSSGRFAPGYGIDPRDNRGSDAADPRDQRQFQRDQRQPQEDQRMRDSQDQRQYIGDQRQLHNDQRQMDRGRDPRDEGYNSSQKQMYNNPNQMDRQSFGGSNTHVYHNSNQNQDPSENQRYNKNPDNQKPDGNVPPQHARGHPGLDPRHSNQSSIVSQNQGLQQGYRSSQTNMAAPAYKQSHQESVSISSNSSRGVNPYNRPDGHLGPPSARDQRISPQQRGLNQQPGYSERAVDVPRGESGGNPPQGYREYNARADPRQQQNAPHDPRQPQSHDHRKRSPDPRFNQSYDPKSSPDQRFHQSQDLRQQNQYRGPEPQGDQYVTKGYAKPYPPPSDSRQGPSHQRNLDPQSSSHHPAATTAGSSAYGRSPNQSQSSQDSRDQRTTPRGGRGLQDGGGAKYFEPLVIDTSPIHEPQPHETQASETPLLQAESRPVPPEMMPRFVHDLAESHTPQSRSDMLTSMETAIIRREKEPLVFQYPEVKVATREPIQTHQHKQDEMPPTTVPQNRQHHFTQPNNVGVYSQDTRRQDQRHQNSQPMNGQFHPHSQPLNQPQQRHSYGQPDQYQPYSQPVSQSSHQYAGKQPSPNQQQMASKSPYTERKTYDTGGQRYGDGYDRSPESMGYRQGEQRYNRPDTQEAQASSKLPPMPDRPPPRRMTSTAQSPQLRDSKSATLNPTQSPVEKTAAQELKDIKNQSIQYSRELENKEEQRLNKHIAASFKRLSLGSEFSRRFREESDPEYDRDPRDDRKSLDLEVESSILKDMGRYDTRMVSTPNSEGYGTLDSVKTNTRSSQGFPGYLEKNNQGTAVHQQEGYLSNYKRSSLAKDYTDSNQVAVVDMKDEPANPSKGLMENIDQDVTNIKNKISSLKNLLEEETKRFSPVPSEEATASTAHLAGHASVAKPWDYGMTRSHPDVEHRIKKPQTGDRHSYAQGDNQNYQTSHIRQRSYDNALTERSNQNKPLSLGNVTHQRQRSYDRYPSSNGSPDFPMHERLKTNETYPSSDGHRRQKSLDSNAEGSLQGRNLSSHQRQASFDSHSLVKDSSQHNRYDRQTSFGSSIGSSSKPMKMSNTNEGKIYSTGSRQLDKHPDRGSVVLSNSRQSSLRNIGGSLDTSESYVPPLPHRTQEHTSNYPGYNEKNHSFGDNIYSNKPPLYKGKDKKSKSLPSETSGQGGKMWKSLGRPEDLNTEKTQNTIEWHETRPGLFSPSKDDSVLLERSRSEKVKRNMIKLESRPKSYAEGLKPPLTKLEKLELENKISRSLGDINLQNLEKESQEFMDSEGIAREGYDPEWDVIKNVLKHRDLPADLAPPLGYAVNQAPPTSSSGSALPYKSPSLGRRQPPPPQQQQDIGYKIAAIKEDPDMPDSQVLEARPLTHIHPALDTQRLRLSISAGDLIGKSHEELVLLLIQLRRAQSRLEGEKSFCKGRLEDAKIRHGSMSRLAVDMDPDSQEIRRQGEEVDKQLEVHKPLVNLVDNLVTMGSLYGGNNLMMASQYKKHKLHPDQYTAPKQMIEFSRRHQEQRLVKEQEEELRKLTEEEIQLEGKLERLFELDRRLQEKSFHVSSLQENKEHLEKAFDSVRKQEEWETDPRERRRLSQQKSRIEQELTRTRQQLAESSRDLEETAAENAKVEHEVILLRKKVYGADKSSPTVAADNMKARAKLERELDKISTVMEGLNKQGAKLQQVMNTLDSEGNAQPNSSPKNTTNTTYYVTDLDTMTSEDISRLSLDPNQSDSQLVDSFKDPPEVQRSIVGDGQFKLHASAPNIYKPNISPSGHAQKVDVNQNTVRQASSSSLDTKGGGRAYNSVQGQSRSMPQDGVYTAKKIFVHSPSPSRRQPESQVAGDRLDSSESDVAQYSPMDINDADDNTKRFYAGILPREKPKSQTLRDVKKREFERKSRGRPEDTVDNDQEVDTRDYRKRSKSLPRRVSDPWGGQQRDPDNKSFDDLVRRPRRKLDAERRKSAAERLFPGAGGLGSGERSASAVNLNSEDRVKSISSIFTPRPFGTPNKNSPAVGIRPVRMQSNPQLSVGPNTWQKDLTVQTVTVTGKQPSPLMSSPPREGEPRDVPEHIKPQVTFAPPNQSSYSIPQKPSPVTIATVHPVQNTTTTSAMYQAREIDPVDVTGPSKSGNNNNNSFMQQFNSWKQSKQNPTATVRPLPNSPGHQKKARPAMKHQRGHPRRQTISSSQPAWFESPGRKEEAVTSSAGDLISGGKSAGGRGLVRSGSLQEVNFDKDTIDRMVLYTPDKVEIPERYVPESDSEESVTEEERLQRQEKTDKMRKMLVEQSLQDWQESEIQPRRGSSLHQSLRQEKQRREQLMDIKHTLAREVTQRSKEVAVNRMKAMSSSQLNGEQWEAEPNDDSHYDGQLQAPPYSSVQQGHGFYA